MIKRMKYFFMLTALLALAPGRTQAAVIYVDDGGHGTGTCTLADAIRSANRNQDVNGCVGDELPYGDDTIILETDVDLESGHDNRPPIMSYYRSITGGCSNSGTVTIEGQGHTIDGKGGDGYVLKVSRVIDYRFDGFLYNEELEEYECNYGGVLTVNNAMITGGNNAFFPAGINMPGNGGGIVNGYYGEFTLNNVTVSGNMAKGNGGGIFHHRDSKFTLNNVTVSGNTAEGYGGGIYFEKTPFADYSILNHVTITGNTAEKGQGGGMYISNYPMGSNLTLKSSIVSNNIASNEGNEIYIYDLGRFSHNSGLNIFGHSDESESDAFYNFTPGTNNNVNATSDGENIPLASILDTTLDDHGGLTKTHALPEGSPAINIDEECSTGLTTDQRGYPRPIGNGCDAGSFEFGSYADAAVDTLEQLIMTVDALNQVSNALSMSFEAGSKADTAPAPVFKNDKVQHAFISQVESVITLVNEEDYAEARDKLQHSILGKTDGCSDSGGTDKNDWILDCASQDRIHPLITEAIGYLEHVN